VTVSFVVTNKNFYFTVQWRVVHSTLKSALTAMVSYFNHTPC